MSRRHRGFIRRAGRIDIRVLAPAVILALCAACAPTSNVSEWPGSPEVGAGNFEMMSDEAFRLGYLAAGLQPAAYLLINHSSSIPSTQNLSSIRDSLRLRGSVLLSLADKAITTTLASGLPPDQEIHVTSAWNAWRRAQELLLSRSRSGVAGRALDEVADEIPPEAVAFGEYMQLAWGDARTDIVAAYLWSSTLALANFDTASCTGKSSSDAGAALASFIAWQERFVTYLLETSKSLQHRRPPPELGLSVESRLKASMIAAGITSAALSEIRKSKRSADSGPAFDLPEGSCEDAISGTALFEEAVSAAAASLGAGIDEAPTLKTAISEALQRIEADGRSDGSGAASRIESIFESFVSGDAAFAYTAAKLLIGEVTP